MLLNLQPLARSSTLVRALSVMLHALLFSLKLLRRLAFDQIERCRYMLAGFLLLALGACSNLQLGYNWGDTVALYYLDSYLDLDAEQEQQVSAGLKQLFDWHRQNQLPAYSRELSVAQQSLQGQLTLQQLSAMNEFLRVSLERTSLQATPMLAELLLSLSPRQVAYLREQLASSNAEYRAEYFSADQQQPSQRRYQLLLEQFESWFGELDPQQLALLRVANTDWPVDEQFWYAERLIRQQEMLATLEYAVQQKPSAAQLQARLQAYIRNFERDREALRQAQIARSRKHAMQLIVAVANRATAEQRQHAVTHAQQLIDDFDVLFAQR